MRFIVDRMLGTLVKWLRVLGYDSLYASKMNDDQILEIALKEKRTIVSRDRELCARMDGALYIPTRDLDGQIAAVVAEWPPDEGMVLTRCLECNSLLRKVGRELVQGRVPENVRARHSEFWTCDMCDKFYWPGTHWEEMMKKAGRFTACRNNPR